MTIEKFPSSQDMAYRKAVAEWRKIMTEISEVRLPKENVEAAAEEMARYWLVINGVPDTYNISVNVGADLSIEERDSIANQFDQRVATAVNPYVHALNYAKQVVFELVMEKHGAVLNYVPGMDD